MKNRTLIGGLVIAAAISVVVASGSASQQYPVLDKIASKEESPANLRPLRALEVLERIGTEEAKEIGLVNDVLPANGFAEKLLERCESLASVPNVFEIKRCLSYEDFVARSELWVERPWKGAASLVDGPAIGAGGPGAREPVAVGRSAQSGDCGCHSSSQRP